MALFAFNKLRQCESYSIGVGWHNKKNTAEDPIAISQSFLQMVFTDTLVIQTLSNIYKGDFHLSPTYQWRMLFHKLLVTCADFCPTIIKFPDM